MAEDGYIQITETGMSFSIFFSIDRNELQLFPDLLRRSGKIFFSTGEEAFPGSSKQQWI
jgi:hypothetical protein